MFINIYSLARHGACKIAPDYRGLQCARPTGSPARKGPLSQGVSKEAGPERLGDLHRIPQRESGGVGVETQTLGSLPHTTWLLVITTQALPGGIQEVKPNDFLGFISGTK